MRSAILVDRSPRPDLSAFLGEWSDRSIRWRGDAGDCGCGCGGCSGKCGCDGAPFGHMDVVAAGWKEALAGGGEACGRRSATRSAALQIAWSHPGTVGLGGAPAPPPPDDLDLPPLPDVEPEPCETRLFQATPWIERTDECLQGVGQCHGAPCVDPEDCWPRTSQLESADKEVQFGEPFTGFSDDEKDLMIAAVAVLRMNLDLFEHACCVAFGPDDDICSCMLDYLEDGGKKIDLRPGTDRACRGGDAYGNVFLGDNIHICKCMFDTFLPDYLGENYSDAKMCAILSIAKSIVAELVHSCGFHHPEQGFCDYSESLMDVLAEGLGRRCVRDAPTPCISTCDKDFSWYP